MTDRDVDPKELLRALLSVSPEDAAEVREIADTKAKPDAKAERQARTQTGLPRSS